jgi:hypothetical protein
MKEGVLVVKLAEAPIDPATALFKASSVILAVRA